MVVVVVSGQAFKRGDSYEDLKNDLDVLAVVSEVGGCGRGGRDGDSEPSLSQDATLSERQNALQTRQLNVLDVVLVVVVGRYYYERGDVVVNSMQVERRQRRRRRRGGWQEKRRGKKKSYFERDNDRR